MEIYILTRRFSAYAGLFSALHGGEFSFSGVEDAEILYRTDVYEMPRIVLADPRFMDEAMARGTPGGGTSEEGIHVIIGSPEAASGIAREIRSASETLRAVRREGPAAESAAEEMVTGSYVAGGSARVREEEEPFLQAEPVARHKRVVIGIAGMSPGAGATFLTLLLAEELAAGGAGREELITVLALEDSSIYNGLGMQQRFRNRPFVDVAAMKDSGRVISPNLNEGISWAVAPPASTAASLAPADKAAVAGLLPGNYLLWDLGARNLEATLEAAGGILDLVILVTDPRPAALRDGLAALQAVKSCGLPVLHVLNKWNTGVDQTVVLEYMDVSSPVLLPLQDTALLYRAEFACENPYRERALRESVADTLQEILARIEELTE